MVERNLKNGNATDREHENIIQIETALGRGGRVFDQRVAAILHLAWRFLTWSPRTHDLGLGAGELPFYSH
jgi:hypothetical protein